MITLSKEKSTVNIQLLHSSPFEEEMSMLIYFLFLHVFRPCLHGHFSLAQIYPASAKGHPGASLTSGSFRCDAVFILRGDVFRGRSVP